MRAVVVEQLGGADALDIRELPEPLPGPGQVTIRVAYAGVNYAEVIARTFGSRSGQLPFVPGLEASGTIEAIGADVRGFSAGQRVTAFTSVGGYAEVLLAPSQLTFAIPDSMDLRTAAALPTVLPTADGLINNAARLRAGESILVHSAAGGVGTVAAQLARIAGARPIIGVTSTVAKAEFAKQFGYDEVLLTGDFDEQCRTRSAKGIDVVLDSVGGDTWRKSLECVARFGRVVSFGNASDAQPWKAELSMLAGRSIGVYGFSIGTLARTSPRDYRPLAQRAVAMVSAGKVTIPITKEYDLDQVREAHRHLESRQSMGKLVLRVAPDA